jgi:hypothetical protein
LVSSGYVFGEHQVQLAEAEAVVVLPEVDLLVVRRARVLSELDLLGASEQEEEAGAGAEVVVGAAPALAGVAAEDAFGGADAHLEEEDARVGVVDEGPDDLGGLDVGGLVGLDGDGLEERGLDVWDVQVELARWSAGGYRRWSRSRGRSRSCGTGARAGLR